jgi:sigma-B regulation protein RsbU (phosphoserine phosphatase)
MASLRVPSDRPALARVLVADDQVDIREALVLLLRTHGYEVMTAASPAAVLKALAAGRFDLLLMDLNYARDTTSGREGLDLLPRVRAADAALPIVAMTAWSTVPLAVATLRLGVGDFVEKPWDNDRLLQVIADQVDAGRSRRRTLRMEEDARVVQGRLLGSAMLRAEGYDLGVAWRFAEGLGGDAYEALPLPDGRLTVAIADVCGKGLPAALLMASLGATLRDVSEADLRPRDACRRIASAMAPRLGSDRFVSLVYAVLDPHRGSLAYVNAGHPPPVLLRADAQSRRLATGGRVIGLERDADYEEGLLALRPGDRLVLFTDGLLEAEDAQGAEFGDERLVEAAGALRDRPAADAAAALVDAASRHAGGALADDATALVVGVAGPRGA